MKITRYGHACVLIEGSKTLIIDPFIRDNPAASVSIDDIPKLDYVLVTHDHFDHFGQAVELALRDGAMLVGVYELTTRSDVVEAKIAATGFNIGGTYEAEGISFGLTQAFHSSSTGAPSGFVIKLDGQTVYQSGDTTVFQDTKLIPELFGDLDIALIPIGGYYTMDETGAAKAVSYLKPKTVIPIHYNTWPVIAADAELFTRLVSPHTKVVILQPGETHSVAE